MINRLALGTAQFGLTYGVANQMGQVGPSEIGLILQTAWRAGIRVCDTAVAYGDSEQRLGAADVSDWKIVTKLPPLMDSTEDVDQWVEKTIAGSLQRLRQPTLWGLLLHDSKDLLGPRGPMLYAALESAKAQGLVAKIGLSIYGPEELGLVFDSYRVDLVQVPLNVLDRRIATSGWLDRMASSGIEIHARSAFLQGLLLMEPEALPAPFAAWNDRWRLWHRWLQQTGSAPVEACLQFVFSYPQIAHVVVGVDCAQHLKQILAASINSTPPPPTDLATEDVRLVEPRNWKRLQ